MPLPDSSASKGTTVGEGASQREGSSLCLIVEGILIAMIPPFLAVILLLCIDA